MSATRTIAKKKVTRKVTRPPTIWDGDRYFDATFTAKERLVLQHKLVDICGYGANERRRSNLIGFDYEIFRPAQDAIWAAFRAQGLEYERDHARLCDWTYIHICRELGFDYRGFAANVPKLPIDGFIECAKRCFPEFKSARNKIERTIQEHKLHAAWTDWMDEECVRTGCTCDSHWLCSDRFVDRDYPAILEQIAAYNETRPKFAPPKLVYSRD
jgi:hypothetical protein